MKALFWAAVSVAMLLYPAAVYFGVQRWGPAVLAGFLAAVVVARSLYFWRDLSVKSVCFPLLVVVYCTLVALNDSVSLLKYYPVLMSCAVAGVFVFSLSSAEPLLEKVARASGKTISPRAKVYLRKLTLIWSLAILLNAAVAAYTACCSSMGLWGLYNGALSYALFAALFVGEWFYRQYYIRRYEGEAPPRKTSTE